MRGLPPQRLVLHFGQANVISQENSEETNTINNLELLNLNLSKCQSEELTHKNYDLHDVGIKLFPGIYKNKNYNLEIGKDNNSINNININDNIMNINNKEEVIKKLEDSDNFVDKDKCMNNKNEFKYNFLHKANSNVIRGEQKKGGGTEPAESRQRSDNMSGMRNQTREV